ncbi:hypothetical protein [Myxococcus virescens]|uniref:Uncharacterized protein n=1 Tax=Myxococcus virescens TaxID=83456 RepID=A0ABY0MMQ1_9BACT|nr:hypothetical protein [Myxococcus virescens]SDD65915.1 hypothetical protein SAMN04488504_102162 [Myxococcus virescens]
MSAPGLTREQLAKHKVPIYTLAAPVAGWEVGPGGMVGPEVTIPVGAQMVSVTRETCHLLLARSGDDQSVADVIFPDGRHASVFYRLSDAANALPEHVERVAWCAKTQTYEPA